MKHVINYDKVKEMGLEVGEFLYLLGAYLDIDLSDPKYQEQCRNGGYIFQTSTHGVEISIPGAQIVEEVLTNSEFTSDDNMRFDSLAARMRELYPEGKKEGTPYLWRDSVAIISKKLKALVKRTGAKFTDEEALAATKAYIESFNGCYRNMRLLKYFISKVETKMDMEGNSFREETSDLLSFIENLNHLKGPHEYDNGRMV